jgi:hypothetical protein
VALLGRGPDGQGHGGKGAGMLARSAGTRFAGRDWPEPPAPLTFLGRITCTTLMNPYWEETR